MKILFLTPWYPDEKNPNHGVFIRDQVTALAKEHTVLVISVKVDYKKFSLSSLHATTKEVAGVKEIHLTIKRSLPVINQLNFFIRSLLFIHKTGRAFRPDIIHSNIGYPGAFLGWGASRMLGVPYVVSEHTRITNNFRSVIHKWLTLFSMRRANVLTAVSRWHAKEISNYTGTEPVVIHNVVNFSRFEIVSSRPTGPFQIGFLGGLNTPVKGLDLLLQACVLLQKDYVLHIGGAGVLLEEYKSLAQALRINDKCIFYGGVPNEEVAVFFKRLHFLVSTSKWETFGVAMVEAMACGLPVVATDSGGPQEFITNENGFLVKGDVHSIAEGIDKMMENYHQYKPSVIRESVSTKFTDQVFLNTINALYKKILGR